MCETSKMQKQKLTRNAHITRRITSITVTRDPRCHNPSLINQQTNPLTEVVHLRCTDELLLFLLRNGRAKIRTNDIRVIANSNDTYRFEGSSARTRTFFDVIIH